MEELDSITVKKQPQKRYFLLMFDCDYCGKSHRLKDMKADMINRFKCSYCNKYEFRVKKQIVSEDFYIINGGDQRIVFEETTQTRGYQKRRL